MDLLSRILGKMRFPAPRSRAAMPDDDPGEGTGTEDAPHADGWKVGGHWGPSDGVPKQEPGPEYIAETVEPSDDEWTHEAELYRDKNKPPSTDWAAHKDGRRLS